MSEPELRGPGVEEFTEEDLERGREFTSEVQDAVRGLSGSGGNKLRIDAGYTRFVPRIGHRMYLIPRGPLYDVRRGTDDFSREDTISELRHSDPIEMRHLDVFPLGASGRVSAECAVPFERGQRYGRLAVIKERIITFGLNEHDVAIVKEDPPHGVEIT